jgi:hypothetical protein
MEELCFASVTSLAAVQHSGAKEPAIVGATARVGTRAPRVRVWCRVRCVRMEAPSPGVHQLATADATVAALSRGLGARRSVAQRSAHFSSARTSNGTDVEVRGRPFETYFVDCSPVYPASVPNGRHMSCRPQACARRNRISMGTLAWLLQITLTPSAFLLKRESTQIRRLAKARPPKSLCGSMHVLMNRIAVSPLSVYSSVW